MASTRSGRVVKTPARFGVFAQENDIITSVSNAKGQRRQLWKVEKVIKRRDDNVLVHGWVSASSGTAGSALQTIPDCRALYLPIREIHQSVV